jgi:hypothetical protein
MHDATALMLDSTGDEIKVFPEPAVSCVFIFTSQTRVTGNIRVEDGGELTWQAT